MCVLYVCVCLCIENSGYKLLHMCALSYHTHAPPTTHHHLTGCSLGRGHQWSGGHASSDELRLCHRPVQIPVFPAPGECIFLLSVTCCDCFSVLRASGCLTYSPHSTSKSIAPTFCSTQMTCSMASHCHSQTANALFHTTDLFFSCTHRCTAV